MTRFHGAHPGQRRPFSDPGGALRLRFLERGHKARGLKKMMIFYMGRRQIHLVPLERVEPQTADAAVEAVKTFAPGVKVADKRKKRRKR